MSLDFDVVIAGAGPVGLFLAAELGLAGAAVLVLERGVDPHSPWRVLPVGLRGLNTNSAEALYRRGLLDEAFEPDEEPRPLTIEKTDGPQFVGHFAGHMLDGNRLDMAAWPYKLPSPSLLGGPTSLARIEGILAARATAHGVVIARGREVTALTEDREGVTVRAGDATYRAKWLVGCDGGRSTVRKAAGFETVGTDPLATGYVLLATFDHPERLPRGFHHTSEGLFIGGPGGQIYVLDYDGGAGHGQPLERERLEAVLRRVSGLDVRLEAVAVASSFTDRARQATTYRRGRVLLAGDSAHIHSPLGAQGMNLGLGDAMNLGWKLGAVVAATAPETLLDTYTAERHPVGASVLEGSRVQVLLTKPDAHGAALQRVVRDLMETRDGTGYFVARLNGWSQRYDLGDEHPLVGASAPDFELLDGTRLGPRFESGRGLLVDFGVDGSLDAIARSYERRVDSLRLDVKNTLGLRALLVRPDGVVAWVAEGAPDVDTLRAALVRWFGAAS
jgi:2-polyprenyl-6-methoxyphenol hydroxylase-like FAD-dependent oxidoreductase